MVVASLRLGSARRVAGQVRYDVEKSQMCRRCRNSGAARREGLLCHAEIVAEGLYHGTGKRQVSPQDLVEVDIYALAARIDRKVVGPYVLIGRDANSMELKRMIVDESARRQGVGRALLEKAELIVLAHGGKEILLEVGVRNIAASSISRAWV